MTEEEEHATTLLGIVELLKSGTVFFVDPGSTKFPDACLQAYDDAGIRAIIGECVSDQEAPFPPAPVHDERRREAHGPRFSASGRGASRAGSRRGPCRSRRRRAAPISCALSRVSRTSTQTFLTLHHGSGPQARKDYQARHGKTPTEYSSRSGCSGRTWCFAHSLGVDDAEIECLARTRHEGRHVFRCRREGRPRGAEHGRMAGASGQGRESRARLRLAQQLEPSGHRAPQ